MTDEAALTRAILVSQKRRRFIRAAQETGIETRWNHGEAPGQAVAWYRGGGYNAWALAHLAQIPREPEGGGS